MSKKEVPEIIEEYKGLYQCTDEGLAEKISQVTEGVFSPTRQTVTNWRKGKTLPSFFEMYYLHDKALRNPDNTIMYRFAGEMCFVLHPSGVHASPPSSG